MPTRPITSFILTGNDSLGRIELEVSMSLGLLHSLVKDCLGYIRRKISKADKIAQLRKRQALKEIFIDKFGMSPQWPLEDALEALIRNIDRIDEYPEEKIKNPRKGWPFFKVELRGLYHDGIEVYNRVVGLRETESGLFVDYGGAVVRIL